MARSLPGFAAFLILGLTGNVGGQAIPVGVARVDITPAGPIRLCGYEGRKAESKGVQQTLWAKALAIGDDTAGPALLVTVDNLGVPEKVTRAVAGRLKTGAGILPERLAVASSHTHSAPCLTGVAPNIFAEPIPADHQARIDAYTSGLIDKLEQVCRDALRDRKPATLAWAQGEVGFALNRRTKGGPVDHALPVLRVADPSGHVRAILVNYACHCTTLDPRDNLISGDWAGDAQQAVEAAYPGAIALVAIGCGADANPEGRVSREAALRHGKALAAEVSRLLGGTMTPLNGLPRCRVERVSLPFDTLPNREALNALVAKGGAPGYNARTQLARLDRGESLQGTLDYSVQSWQFGDDLMMVFLPGEVVVDYVLRLKKELDPARLWVTAYANDEPCYIPSERILKEGGYEGGGAMAYYARPTKLKAGVENLIVEAVRKIVPPAFEAGAARKGP